MTTQEAIHDIQKIVGAKLAVLDIRQVWTPHQYVISEEAAKWMDIHVQGFTTPDNVRTTERLLNARCMSDGCTLLFNEHNVQTIVYLQCRANMGYQYAKTRIDAMAVYMNRNGINEYKFVSNKQGYTIAPRKVKL